MQTGDRYPIKLSAEKVFIFFIKGSHSIGFAYRSLANHKALHAMQETNDTSASREIAAVRVHGYPVSLKEKHEKKPFCLFRERLGQPISFAS